MYLSASVCNPQLHQPQADHGARHAGAQHQRDLRSEDLRLLQLLHQGQQQEQEDQQGSRTGGDGREGDQSSGQQHPGGTGGPKSGLNSNSASVGMGFYYFLQYLWWDNRTDCVLGNIVFLTSLLRDKCVVYYYYI